MFYALLILFLIIFDQLSKYFVVENFSHGETLSFFEGVFHLTYVQNRGIAFGMFQNSVKLVSILTIIIIIGIGIHIGKELKNSRKIEKIAYSFIFAGALGNMIDRIFRGFVVDMMDFKIFWTYIFNLADAWICIGAFLLIVDYFVGRRKK